MQLPRQIASAHCMPRRTPIARLRQAARLCQVALAIAVLCAQPPQVAAEKGDKDHRDEAAEEIDHLSLAARLMKDGHYDRADRTLAGVDEKAEHIDRVRLHTLRGLIALKLQRPTDARDHLRRAVKSGTVEQTVFLHLAQAEYELGDHAATIAALDSAKEAAAKLPGAYLIRAQCHWALERQKEALQVLSEGERRFPKEADFPRRRYLYLVDLGLYQQALDLGQRFVKRADATEDDYAAMGEALRQAREYRKAGLVLEAGRLRFPESERLTLLLAHTYLAEDRPLSAAMLFESAAMRNPEHSLEAAELYRRARRFDRALALNARVLEQRAKLKQRMSALIEMERFEMVVAMEAALSRLGMLEDEDIRYALAYAQFKTGDFPAAERSLKGIRGAALFASATELRKMMQTCKEAGWECL
jgi:tetratricopeptide (TPR) repeat protein